MIMINNFEIMNILNKVLKFSKYTTEMIGENNKFHTLYCIEFENGCFYIGIHSTANIKTDNYFCSGSLPNKMKRDGVKYKRTITHYLPTRIELSDLETKILQSNLYNNDKCLNCYNGTPPDAAGTIVIHLGNKFKMINPKLKDIFLEKGWELGAPKYRKMNKDGINKNILIDKVEEHLSEGWEIGQLKRDAVCIEKSGIFKFIRREFLQDYLCEGWLPSSTVKNKIVLRNKENKIIKVDKNMESFYKEQGFFNTSTVDGLIYIRKNKQFKRVPVNELDEYLNNGWIKGNNTSDKIYINNGTHECRIDEDDFENYQGYIRGRIPLIQIHNNVNWVYLHQKSKHLKSLLSNGWQYGKPNHTKHISFVKFKRMFLS